MFHIIKYTKISFYNKEKKELQTYFQLLLFSCRPAWNWMEKQSYLPNKNTEKCTKLHIFFYFWPQKGGHFGSDVNG